jgi:hypothetical protein
MKDTTFRMPLIKKKGAFNEKEIKEELLEDKSVYPLD